MIGETENIAIPKAVGVKLKRLEQEDREFPSRAELLYTLREISVVCAHERMERLVNFREYSAAELTQKLLDDGYLPELVEDIVNRAREVGVINDDRFCESFIRSKLNAGWGTQRIVRELQRRGITTDTLESLEELLPLPEVELERAYEHIRGRKLSGRDDYQKIVRHLVTRGYSLSVAKSTAVRLLDEAREDF